ncbi:MAG: hypothetical protein H6Q51_2530 [Deltaproteobacteria bacterium]|nr:hypothetical protein [Deltaproteobacteria bacterium]
MELQDYCRNVHIELSGWKAKMYDIVRRLDKLPTGDKAKVVDQVNDLHIIVEELEDRLYIIVEELEDRLFSLEKECPTEWSPVRTEIQNKLQALGYKWEEAWKAYPGGFYGG